MSRIHEALKKAEQERPSAQGGIPSGLRAAPVSEAPAYAHVEAAPVTPNLEMTALGPFSLESLLTTCPHTDWNPDLEIMLFMNGNDSAKGTEEYRTLRSRLYRIREKMPLKKLLVTSALPREGKSFTTGNLAQVMVRQHGRRALMIDANLRAPRLHQMLGTLQGPGLSEYLLGEADESSVIQHGPMQGLYFTPSGEALEDPAQLVASSRLKILFERIEPLFDWIIIDSPPAIPFSDASVLAKACDGVLIVVRSASTPADMARKVRLEFPEEMLVGVVLNGSDAGWSPRAASSDETGRRLHRGAFRGSRSRTTPDLAQPGRFIGQELNDNQVPHVGIGSVSAPNTSFGGGANFNRAPRWRAGFSDKELFVLENLVGSTLYKTGMNLRPKIRTRSTTPILSF